MLLRRLKSYTAVCFYPRKQCPLIYHVNTAITNLSGILIFVYH